MNRKLHEVLSYQHRNDTGPWQIRKFLYCQMESGKGMNQLQCSTMPDGHISWNLYSVTALPCKTQVMLQVDRACLTVIPGAGAAWGGFAILSHKKHMNYLLLAKSSRSCANSPTDFSKAEDLGEIPLSQQTQASCPYRAYWIPLRDLSPKQQVTVNRYIWDVCVRCTVSQMLTTLIPYVRFYHSICMLLNNGFRRIESSSLSCFYCCLDVSEDHFDIWGTWHSTLKSGCKDPAMTGQLFLKF